MSTSPTIRAEEGLLSAPRIRFVAITVLIMATLVVSINFATYDRGRTYFGPNLGGDFGAFYLAGVMLREESPSRLYDFPLQQSVYHRLFPNASDEHTAYFPYAPFIAGPFAAFAALPYPVAFGMWTALSLTCYLISLRIFLSLTAEENHMARLLTLVSVSFFPYLMECLLGGQTSSVALLCFAMAIRSSARGSGIQAGLWLSVLSYKPTLLGLAIVMLCVQRRWSVILGGLLGGVLLAAVSWLTVGVDGIQGFIELLQGYADMRRGQSDAMKWYKYVDLGNVSWWPLWRQASVPLRIGALGALIIAFYRLSPLPASVVTEDAKNQTGRASLSRRDRMSWAVTLACTPVVSPHCGVYDSVLIVGALLLMRPDLSCSTMTDAWRLRVAALYTSACVGQVFGVVLGVNPYTVCLAWIAAALAWHAWQFVDTELGSDAMGESGASGAHA